MCWTKFSEQVPAGLESLRQVSEKKCGSRLCSLNWFFLSCHQCSPCDDGGGGGGCGDGGDDDDDDDDGWMVVAVVGMVVVTMMMMMMMMMMTTIASFGIIDYRFVIQRVMS